MEGIDADLVARDPVALIPASRSALDCPLPWLPYLASERSVDEFDSAWAEERQRAVVSGSMAYHQVKGTRPALDRALAPLGFGVRVLEWFEVSEQRRPNTFRLKLDLGSEPWTAGTRAMFVRTANSAKNLHTMLDGIETSREVGPAAFYVGAIVVRRETIHVGQVPTPTTIHIPAFGHFAAIQRHSHRLIVGPRP